MAEYYKYVERDADSQINYFDLGQQAVGMLQDWQQGREEKKEAYRQDYRESLNNLMDAPQGENQDANFFINNYAHDAINQKKIDYDLLTRGQISQREYTLKSQNQIDGTKQLFEIQKLYQENYAAAMKGIQDGTLQSGINIFNMGMVEGYGDFNNSKATINPKDGTVGIGLMETKIVDGKPVRVLSQNIAPVNVIRGKILQKVPTFDVDNKTTSFVKNLGELKSAVYSAATTSRAGTITELTGLDFVNSIKDPATKAIVGKFNQAINDQVESYFSNPYNLTSVLTENLGEYNSNSFTFDKTLADKDPKKILVKIDPTTQMTTLDDMGKNYEAQKKQATDYVRTQIISKIDEEKKVSTTGQLEESSATKLKNELKYRAKTPEENKAEEADNATNMIGKLYYGDDNQVQSSIDYFKGLKNDKGEILFKDIIRNGKEGITVYLADGSSEKISFLDKNNKPRAQEDFIASAGPLLAGQLDVSKSLSRGAYKKGAKFNKQSEGRGTTVERFTVDSSVVSKPSQDAVEDVQSALPEGFTAKDTGNYIPFSKTQNQVTVTSPTGKKYVVTTSVKDVEGDSSASQQAIGLEDFVNSELKKNRNKPAGTTKGVGSKY